jgi:hypothetical protein
MGWGYFFHVGGLDPDLGCWDFMVIWRLFGIQLFAGVGKYEPEFVCIVGSNWVY